MFKWLCNIDGNIMNMIMDNANNLFHLFGQTKNKRIDFGECNLKECIFSIAIAPLNEPERKIDFTFQNNALEWEDEADEFNLYLLGVVRPGFYVHGEENKRITEKNSVV